MTFSMAGLTAFLASKGIYFLTAVLLSLGNYINPLPHGLMLTAIVVSLGTTGVGLALLTRIKEKYGSVEEEEIIRGENKFR